MIRSSELVSESAWSSALFMSETVVALGVVEDVSLRQRILLVFLMVCERESGRGIACWLGCRETVEVAVMLRRVEWWCQCVLESVEV